MRFGNLQKALLSTAMILICCNGSAAIESSVSGVDVSEAGNTSISTSNSNASSSQSRRTLFTLEAGGRNAWYGVGAERSISPQVSAGIAFGYYHFTNNWTNTTASPFITGYSSSGHNRAFLTASALLDFAQNECDYTCGDVFGVTTDRANQTGFGVIPTAGLGYEYRSDEGFVARASAYAFFVRYQVGDRRDVLPWVGLTVGHTL